jgi:hypothetical protein
MTQLVVGVANLPEFGKFRVYLECGHIILYDHTVDAVSEYTVLHDPPLRLICFFCKEEHFLREEE